MVPDIVEAWNFSWALWDTSGTLCKLGVSRIQEKLSDGLRRPQGAPRALAGVQRPPEGAQILFGL